MPYTNANQPEVEPDDVREHERPGREQRVADDVEGDEQAIVASYHARARRGGHRFGNRVAHLLHVPFARELLGVGAQPAGVDSQAGDAFERGSEATAAVNS